MNIYCLISNADGNFSLEKLINEKMQPAHSITLHKYNIYHTNTCPTVIGQHQSF
jgi:hypothetical protein